MIIIIGGARTAAALLRSHAAVEIGELSASACSRESGIVWTDATCSRRLLAKDRSHTRFVVLGVHEGDVDGMNANDPVPLPGR